MPSFRFLIRAVALAVLVAAVVLVAAAEAPVGKAAGDSPIASVNPFIGTEDEGNTFPGASAPFGMVQLSPDTGHSTGYSWSDPRIRGFSHTHLSGAGCPAMGDVPFMPTTGPVNETRSDRYASGYSKQTESARPGSYAVTLSRYGVRAELTSTTRTGWHRYTFPATNQANVLVNIGQADQTTFGSSIRVVGDRQIEGTVVSGHFCSAPNRYTLHFSATFDRPFAAYGTWRDDRLHPGSRSSSAGGRNESDGAFVRFDARGDHDVVAKVALSYVDVDGARRNLAREAPGFDFDGVRDRDEQQWAQALDRIQVDGGTPDQRTSFYSALYRAQLTPTTFSDADGRYAGFDGRVHRTGGRVQYANFSLWDTYRPQNQLLELIVPDVARDTQLSLVADAQQNGGWLPRWPMASGDTNVMTGDPAAPFLVDGYAKGLLGGHERGVFRLLWRNANGVPPWRVGTMGRVGNPDYTRLGYVPFDGGHNVAKDGDDDIHQGGSSTLEYALSDCASSQLAAGLGYRWRAAQLRKRSQGYRKLWNWNDREFRARFKSGTFAQRSSANGSGFHEGTPSQYTWLVPQDMAGLVHLLGGRWRAAQALNRFFANGDVRQWVTEPYGYYGRQTYNPNNEPDLHAPWAYAWVGRPWRTTQMVRVAQSLFVPKPGGLTGNDDLGTMSAWYVFASLGIYPVTSGSPYYALHTPLFPHITVAAGARRLTIDAPGTSASTPYIQSVAVGGRPTTRTWVWHGDLLRAGSLSFATGAQPDRGWGTRPQDAPPSPCGS